MSVSCDDDSPVYERPSITVYPLKENKRPVGFAPWPVEKAKRKRAAKARKKGTR
jgi:hypothetical protein